MAKKEAVVKNAASEKQVKDARLKEKYSREAELLDVIAVMKTPEGRRFVWRVLGHCKTFGSVVHPSGSMTYYNSGQQDVGHFILGEINSAGQKLFIKMMEENYNEGDENV